MASTGSTIATDPPGTGGPDPTTAPLFDLTQGDTLRIKLGQIADRLQLRTAPPVTNTSNGRYEPAPRQLPTIPGVQSLAIATRYLIGGRQRFVELVWAAVLEQQPEATRWWLVYADLVTAERHRVSFDDVCVAAGVRPSSLMAEVVSTAMEQGVDVGNLVAAAAHPAIVRAAAKSAKRIGGDYAEIAMKDRHALLQARGVLPVPKNASIHVHANASATSQAAAAAQADPSVPSFADNMTALAVPRRVVQQQLTEATPDLDLINPAAVADAVLVARDEE